MEITFTNKKYYCEYDNSDNQCCWQVDLVIDDLADILEKHGIDADLLCDDWGSAYSWIDNRIEYSLMITCEDVDLARYKILFEAFRTKLAFFNKQVKIEGKLYGQLVSDIKQKLIPAE